MINTSEIAAPFQFIGSSVRKLDISNNFVKMDDSSEIKRTFDVSYSIDDAVLDDHKWIGLLTLSVWVSCNFKSPKARPASFSLKLELQGCFTAPEQLPEEEFHKLLSVNGCTALYSVARGVVVSTSAQVFDGGSIRLPMVNIFKLRERTENS